MALPLSAIGKAVELLVKHGPKAWAKVRELYEGHNPADGLGGLEAVWATACGDFFRSLADRPEKAHLARALKYETVDDAALESHLRGLWAHWETLMRRHSTGPSATDDVDGALAALTESWPVADDSIRQQLTAEFDGWLHRNLPGYIAGVPHAFAKSTLDAFRELPKRVADEFESRRSHAAQPPTAVPAHPPEIRGREDEITAALKLLESQPFVALSGPSGVGKSVIQLHVAARWHDVHQKGVAQPSGAGGPEELLTRLEDRFSVPHDGDESARIDRLRPAIARVVGLLALDGVDDETTLKLVRKLAAANGSVRVIVSTIRRNTPTESWVVPIELPGTALARAILAQYAGTVLPNADELIAACGALPMALRIVGTIAAEDGPESAARAVAKPNFTSLADESKEGPHDSLDGLLRYLLQRLDASKTLSDDDKEWARKALSGFGLLGGDTVPVWFFTLALGAEDEDTVRPALSFWRRYSIVEVEAEGTRLRVHNLIRKATVSVRSDTDVEAQWLEATRGLIAGYNVQSNSTKMEFARDYLRPVREHVEAALSHPGWGVSYEAGAATIFGGWAFALAQDGHLNAAEAWLRKAIEIAERLGDETNLTISYNNLSGLHQSRGDLAEAEMWLRRAIEIEKRLDDEPKLAVGYNNLSQIYQDRPDLAGAEEWLIKAIAIWEKLDDEPRLAVGCSNLSAIQYARGNFGGAEAWIRKAIEIDERLGDEVNLAIDYNNLFGIHHVRGEMSEAEAYLRSAIEILRRIDDPLHLAMGLRNLSVLLIKKQMAEEAFRSINEAWVLIRPMSDSTDRRQVARTLAQALDAVGLHDKAEQVRIEGNVAALEAAEKEKQGL